MRAVIVIEHILSVLVFDICVYETVVVVAGVVAVDFVVVVAVAACGCVCLSLWWLYL